MATKRKKRSRFGMVIDLDRCNGCGACMIACAIENNVPPARSGATDRTGINWMRVYKLRDDAGFPTGRAVFIPVLCQQCGKDTPCVSVCPQQAVQVDPNTGIVAQMPERCLGCRYCMAACPYHARYFNWWDPQFSEGMEKVLNPDVAPRMRGVVEKCNFCHGRLHRAQERAAAEGRRELQPDEYVPACVEACPSGAITFGDLDEENGEAARQARSPEAFRLLQRLGTEPKVYYRSRRQWVHQIAQRAPAPKEQAHG